jgi:hypothetical protein
MRTGTNYGGTREKRAHDRPFEPNKKHRKRRHDYSNSNNVTDGLPDATTAEVQRNIGTNHRACESEPGCHDDGERGSSDKGQQVTSNNEQIPECPICLEKLITQKVGTTDTCNHTFCLACLQEWLRRVNNCPLDRQTFDFIFVRHHLDGEIIVKIPTNNEAESYIVHSHPFLKVCTWILHMAFFFVIFVMMGII